MMGAGPMSQSAGLTAIEREMSRQKGDARRSFLEAQDLAQAVAASIRRSGGLLLLGMGASHGLNRAVEPLFRNLGIDAVAIPLSEQLDHPLSTAGRSVIVTSQSGESAEVVRWLHESRPHKDSFGLTMDAGSSLARALPSLIGAGGVETGFAATRSLYVGVALLGAVLGALGADTSGMLAAIDSSEEPDIAPAPDLLGGVRSIVTSGRQLRGLAEALALGFAELARLPCLALESGQFRHGPMEMLGPDLGAVFFRGTDATGDRVRAMAEAVAAAGARTIVLDASGQSHAAGCLTISPGRHDGLAALSALLPISQRLMIRFAAARVADVGLPLHSQKVTRTE
jgi:fructoselysine-6-P-deglycase FrlB-like protein